MRLIIIICILVFISDQLSSIEKTLDRLDYKKSSLILSAELCEAESQDVER